jgi:hypothetical protein
MGKSLPFLTLGLVHGQKTRATVGIGYERYLAPGLLLTATAATAAAPLPDAGAI